jgi:putative sterol carrier protein
MENPTAILTLGLGALVAVAGYLGWTNLKPDTPSIIDSDVHKFDSNYTENVVLKTTEVEEKKETNEEQENLQNKIDKPIELKVLKKETTEEILNKASENATIANKISNTWGQFWKGEYDNMNQKAIEEH